MLKNQSLFPIIPEDYPLGVDHYGYISTLEGDIHIVTPGDWIIQGVKGEYYACKPDIFEMTYEAVNQVEWIKYKAAFDRDHIPPLTMEEFLQKELGASPELTARVMDFWNKAVRDPIQQMVKDGLIVPKDKDVKDEN